MDRLDRQRAATTHSSRQTLAPSSRTDTDCSTCLVASRRYLSQSIASTVYPPCFPASRAPLHRIDVHYATFPFRVRSLHPPSHPPPPIQIQGPDCRFSWNRLHTFTSNFASFTTFAQSSPSSVTHTHSLRIISAWSHLDIASSEHRPLKTCSEGPRMVAIHDHAP